MAANKGIMRTKEAGKVKLSKRTEKEKEMLMIALTDAQLKIADQQQLIEQSALAITELQLKGGTA